MGPRLGASTLSWRSLASDCSNVSKAFCSSSLANARSCTVRICSKASLWPLASLGMSSTSSVAYMHCQESSGPHQRVTRSSPSPGFRPCGWSPGFGIPPPPLLRSHRRFYGLRSKLWDCGSEAAAVLHSECTGAGTAIVLASGVSQRFLGNVRRLSGSRELATGVQEWTNEQEGLYPESPIIEYTLS